MTLKMNTLQDKKEKVTNFEECVDIYKIGVERVTPIR